MQNMKMLQIDLQIYHIHNFRKKSFMVNFYEISNEPLCSTCLILMEWEYNNWQKGQDLEENQNLKESPSMQQ